MIPKETYRRLFDDLTLNNGERIGNEMYYKDADIIFNWFFEQMNEQYTILVKTKENALLESHIIKDLTETKLLEIIRNDRYKKLNFIYKITETINRPDVFSETYLKGLSDVLNMYKDDHPEIKNTDIAEYTKQLINKFGKKKCEQPSCDPLYSGCNVEGEMNYQDCKYFHDDNKPVVDNNPVDIYDEQLNYYKNLIAECKLQLEYLNQKFGETGTTNSLLSRLPSND